MRKTILPKTKDYNTSSLKQPRPLEILNDLNVLRDLVDSDFNDNSKIINNFEERLKGLLVKIGELNTSISTTNRNVSSLDSRISKNRSILKQSLEDQIKLLKGTIDRKDQELEVLKLKVQKLEKYAHSHGPSFWKRIANFFKNIY